MLTATLLLTSRRQRLLAGADPARHRPMVAYASAPEDAPRRSSPPMPARPSCTRPKPAWPHHADPVDQALKQKERLARAGSAVAKISHDLRNILTTRRCSPTGSRPAPTRRCACRAEAGESRSAARSNLCEATLAFGKAEEPAPSLSRFNLAATGQRGAPRPNPWPRSRIEGGEPVEFLTDIPSGLMVRADRASVVPGAVQSGAQCQAIRPSASPAPSRSAPARPNRNG